MNKYFASLTLIASLLFSTHVKTTDYFINLVPFICTVAPEWVVNEASEFLLEQQIFFLNLYVLNNGVPTKAFMHCVQFLEDKKEDRCHQSFGASLAKILSKYADPIIKKVDERKEKNKLKEEEIQKIYQQLMEKIHELIIYCNKYYYQALYNHVAQKNPEALMYMFDDNGFIAPEKRTTRLPESL